MTSARGKNSHRKDFNGVARRHGLLPLDYARIEVFSDALTKELISNISGAGCIPEVQRCIAAAGGLQAARKSGALVVKREYRYIDTLEDLTQVQDVLNDISKDIAERYPRLLALEALPRNKLRLTVETYDFRRIHEPPVAVNPNRLRR